MEIIKIIEIVAIGVMFALFGAFIDYKTGLYIFGFLAGYYFCLIFIS